MSTVKIPDLNLLAHSISEDYRDEVRIHSDPLVRIIDLTVHTYSSVMGTR
jgi:hypothetical protein